MGKYYRCAFAQFEKLGDEGDCVEKVGQTLEEKCKRNQADLLGVLVDDDDIRSTSTITAVVYILHHPEGREWWLAKARKEAEDTNVGNDIPLDQLRSSVTRCETRCGLTRTATRGKITYWCCLQL